MATSNKEASSARHAHFAVCLFAAGLGLVGCLWGLVALPTAWRDAPVLRIGARVLDGDPFKDSVLMTYLPVLDDIEAAVRSRADTLRSAMLIRFRLLEDAVAFGEREAIELQTGRLHHSVERLLTTAPDDSFAWLTLYWLENTEEGFTTDHLKYLSMSYLTGPNEGWIAVRRNRLTLAIYPEIPRGLLEKAMTEFVGLIDSGFYREGAEILVGPGWPIRRTLLPRLAAASQSNRQLLDRYMLNLGYAVSIPGIEHPEARPWQ